MSSIPRKRTLKRRASTVIKSLPPPSDPKKVFVSSTQMDLSPFREAAADVITRIDWHPVRPAEQGSLHAGPILRRCVEDIQRSDFFVLLVGYRYGSVPRKENGGDGHKSVTELEYMHWKLRETFCSMWPAIVFMADNDDQLLALNETEESRGKQILFRARLKLETAVHGFRFVPTGNPAHSDAIREFKICLKDQLLQAKDRIAEQTKMQALRAQAAAQKHVIEAQNQVQALQHELAAAQAQLQHLRDHQPANMAALVGIGGLIGYGIAREAAR